MEGEAGAGWELGDDADVPLPSSFSLVAPLVQGVLTLKHQNDHRESPWGFIQGSVWRCRGAGSPAVQQGGLFLGVSHLTAASTTLPTPWHTLGMQGAPPA